MRELFRASVAFLCTDILTKKPIDDIVIFFDKELKKIIKKREGYCVFTDLYPKKYDVVIRAPGYREEKLELEVHENETKTVFMTMIYDKHDKRLYNMRRFKFRVKADNKPLPNTKVIIKLCNNLEFFKLVEPIYADSLDAYTNIEIDDFCVVQHYFYNYDDRQEYKLFFTGYDYIKNCYILEDFPEKEIKTGGELHPYWELETDENGDVVLPFMPRFMREDKIKFEVRTNEKRGNKTVNVSQIPDDKLYKVNIKIGDYVEPEPEPEEDIAPPPEIGDDDEENIAPPPPETGDDDEEDIAPPPEIGDDDEENIAPPPPEIGDDDEENIAPPPPEIGDDEDEDIAPPPEIGDDEDEDIAPPPPEIGNE